MFNKRSSPYLILVSMLALIYAIYFYWHSMNLAAVFVSYLLGSTATMLAVFYWDNRNLGKPILKLAREMTFSFGGAGPVTLVEGVIPDGSHAAGDSIVLTNVLRGYIDNVSIVVVKIGIKKSGVRAAASIQMKKRLPLFRLRPKGTEDIGQFSTELRKEVGTVFSGGSAVEFPEDPTFSEKYQLEAVDEKEIRRLFSPTALNFFAMTPKLAVDGGPWLVITTALIGTPREFKSWLLQLSDIYNLLSGVDSPSLRISVNHSSGLAHPKGLVARFECLKTR